MFNIIDIIVVLVILFSVFLGYKKGFVKTVVSLLSFFVAIGMALFFYKPFAVILTVNTTIDDWIIENIVSKEYEEKNLNQPDENLETPENIVGSDKEESKEGLEAFLEMIEVLPNTISQIIYFYYDVLKEKTVMHIVDCFLELYYSWVDLTRL